ncbi:DUF1389 domain-containing protein [Chlamydia abortus]|uniref:DUF1389 domain-containing protein n=2 Tax=Chlamydia abortus TaxID=83555 RepID=UPI000A27EFCD|nr:DUF1389 domain-containing protein [Chlamydia abortus]SGA04506.1 putative transmembrane protein [Chlamydia abortus]SGA09883.1 putative transmembrane protein [Chlamydia abortus]SGA17489.1 putative transmembrane protein [Chlamydia abortus]SGA18096.1 putative transmembrane protein [Chlamydia abortus]SGA24698.1 putative transmembrane protein [Chlamydia abortus]
MMAGLNSETTFTLDSDAIGNVLAEEVPVVLDRVEDKSLVSVAEAASDFHLAREESRDEESTSILDTAFQLSYSSTDAPSITEATGAVDCDLGLLFDPASAVDTEATFDAEGDGRAEAFIPASFHGAIGRHYPEMIHQLCVQENLTIQEFRLLIEGLNQGNSIDSYPNHIKIKLQNFSFPNLQSTCVHAGLLPLDDVLLKECPFYFINRLIAMGDRKFPESQGLSPEVYWTNRRGFASCYDTIFTPFVWVLSRIVSKEEYLMLLDHAENETWSQTKALIVELQSRMISYIDNVYQPSFSLKKSHVKWETRKSSPFLHLCKHGFNWEQLQLFTKLDSRYIDFLCEIESQSRGGHLCRSMIATSRYIQEAETSFDPHVTLLTWEEWIEDYQDSCRRDQRWRAHESTVTLLNRRRDEREPLEAITMDHELFVGQPYYDYDLNTGARRKSD